MSTINQGTAKAWINFNGTGTIAARDSFNVGSISDEGTGKYNINLASSMNNDDYCVTCGAGRDSTTYHSAGFQPPTNLTTSQYNISSTNSAGTATDFEQPMSQIVGDLA
jgi:hypothetical protein